MSSWSYRKSVLNLKNPARALVFIFALSLAAAAAPQTVPSVTPPSAIQTHNKLISSYCATCHNDTTKAGQQSFFGFDVSKAAQNAPVAEKMIRKLRAGMMPPPQAPRPDAASLQALATFLEDRIDRAAALVPNPGRRTFQRLNRAEYAQAVRDMLALNVDVNAFLPPDTLSEGFDNIAEAQGFSPALAVGYLRAARRITALALGDRTTSPTEATYKVPRTAAQTRHIEGTPWGTRGGISVIHTFPADGEYSFRIMLHSVPSGRLYATQARGEQIEVSVNGTRVALLDIDHRMSEADENGMNLVTPRVHVQAGPQRVSAAFIQRSDAPVDDLIAPIEYTLADTQIGEFGWGITALPHLRDFSITGPFRVTGVSDTPSRRKVFSCRPTATGEELPCARKIVQQIASQAYRRPVTGSEITGLMKFYDDGRKGGDFESGVQMAIQAILVSPRFLFRLEQQPAGVQPGETFVISDADLAARLSFFIWAAGPDAELLQAASAGSLRTAIGLRKQVTRMLKDPRAEALSERFASQWLRLQDVDKIRPDALLYPSFDYWLAESFKNETKLLFDSIVREDRNVFDLLNADYTFVNERIARHYGIPNVTGDHFRRVALGSEMEHRRGILGQGSFLLSTSVADRTSPVQRGKWVMEVLLGTPPPPPPPNVPALDETEAVSPEGKVISTRKRMEEHRRNPGCASCHRFIDPIGLALENFDVTGRWRIKDNGTLVDANGDLYDGAKVNGPKELRDGLLTHKDALLRNFTENLMSYAIGRRIEYYDQPTVRSIVKAGARQNNRFSEFVFGIVSSPAFRTAKSESTLETQPGEKARR